MYKDDTIFSLAPGRRVAVSAFRNLAGAEAEGDGEAPRCGSRTTGSKRPRFTLKHS